VRKVMNIFRRLVGAVPTPAPKPQAKI